MLPNSKKSKDPGHVQARIQNLLSGLAKLGPQENLDVLGTSSAPGTLSSQLGTMLVPFTTADQAHQAVSEAVKARDAGRPDTVKFIEGIEAAVKSHFGASSPRLTDFGMKPKKAPRKLTPEERLAATEKAKATRTRVKQARAAQPAPAPKTGTCQGGAATS
jgi:hypothetical protein